MTPRRSVSEASVSTTPSPSRSRPLPLKQRTSSIDGRRDYSTQTWLSLLELLKIREYVVTVNHFSIWRRHMAWAYESGHDLKEYMTQRYASSMVFMSLLLSTELMVLFNSAGVTTQVRHALMTENYLTVSFWAGIAVILSAVLTLLSLISNFTAWTMLSAVNEANVHAIFRSSIGQYVAELPGRFIVGSIYSFLLWFLLFMFLLFPFGMWSTLLVLIGVGLFVHVITAFSAFGRIIMHSGAMSSQRIFDPNYEASLVPHTLHSHLLVKARANLTNNTSIRRQYRRKHQPIDRWYTEDELSLELSADSGPFSSMNTTATEPPFPPPRKRTDSQVKFWDGFDTNGDPFQSTTSRPKDVTVQSNKTPVSALSGSTTMTYNGSTYARRKQQRTKKRPTVAQRMAEFSLPLDDHGTAFGNRGDSDDDVGITSWLGGPPRNPIFGAPPPPPSHLTYFDTHQYPTQGSSAFVQQAENANLNSDNSDETVDDQELNRSEDIEFEREYGNVLDPAVPNGRDDGNEEDVDEDGDIETAERTGLLRDDPRGKHGNGTYSSFQDTSNSRNSKRA